MPNYKTFTNGVILDASELNLLMKQTVATFVSAAERTASIPVPTIGQMCYVTGLGLQEYIGAIGPNPAGWRTLFADVPYAKYGAADATQAIPSATWRRLKLTAVLYPPAPASGGWTPQVAADGGTTFRCDVAGRYAMTAFLRLNTGSAGHRALSIANGTSQAGDTCAYTGGWMGGADYWATTIYGERTFLQNDTLAVWVWQTTSPAVSLTPFTDMGLPHLTIRRIVG